MGKGYRTYNNDQRRTFPVFVFASLIYFKLCLDLLICGSPITTFLQQLDLLAKRGETIESKLSIIPWIVLFQECLTYVSVLKHLFSKRKRNFNTIMCNNWILIAFALVPPVEDQIVDLSNIFFNFISPAIMINLYKT